MGFTLQTRPVSPKLAQAFGDNAAVELREIPWLSVIEAMRAGAERGGLASHGLLAASLHIDGVPIGLDALLALPGRFTGALGAAMAACHSLHGIGDDDAPEGEAPNV